MIATNSLGHAPVLRGPTGQRPLQHRPPTGRRASSGGQDVAATVDLLKADEFRRYVARPERLREELEAAGPDPSRQVVIDEVQKVPALLDEVHWLIENRGLSFALCGSSARKVRRGAANLLGGRAVRYGPLYWL